MEIASCKEDMKELVFGASQSEWARRGRFFIVTFLAYVLYLGVYTFLHRTWPFVLGAIFVGIATVSGDLLNYFGNRYWVFRASTEAVARQGMRFFVVMIATLCVQVSFFWIGMRLQLLPEAVLLLILPVIRTVLNYMGHKGFTFRKNVLT